jgi:hypothetical protein
MLGASCSLCCCLDFNNEVSGGDCAIAREGTAWFLIAARCP